MTVRRRRCVGRGEVTSTQGGISERPLFGRGASEFERDEADIDIVSQPVGQSSRSRRTSA